MFFKAGIWKGCLFKRYAKGVYKEKGLDLGAEPPRIIFMGSPPGTLNAILANGVKFFADVCSIFYAASRIGLVFAFGNK